MVRKPPHLRLLRLRSKLRTDWGGLELGRDSNGGGYCYLKHVPKCNCTGADIQDGQFTASATLKVAPKGVPLDGFVPGKCNYK